MRNSALLLGTSLTYLLSALAANATINVPFSKSIGATTNTGSAFVTAPYTSGAQQLFTASIVNVNTNSLNSLAALTGNNAGSAPQGGVGSKQGGLGFATVGLAFTKGASATTGVVTNGTANGTTSSAGFSSANNTSGTSSAGSISINNTSGSSSVGFSSANNTSGTSSTGFSSANNTSGTSSTGFSSANNTSGTSSTGFSSSNNTSGASSAGFSSANTASSAGTSTSTTSALNALNTNGNGNSSPVLVLSSLINSTDPRAGSAGAVFQGINNTQISSVSFRYGTLAAASGQAGATTSITPVLVIDDQPNGASISTRYIPLTSGTRTTARNGGLTTVTFNASQLRVSGQVQRIGVALYQRGQVVIDGITVNGVPSSGIVAQAQQSFPF